MAVDWADLPLDIVELISNRITVYSDYLRFRCLRSSWNSYLPKIPLHLPPQLPWLMISNKSFFDLSTKKIHSLNLPSSSFHQTLIIGSSHGWLVILHKTYEVHLLNPITSATVSLPSLHAFSELVRVLIKVVLSSSPLVREDFSALAILNSNLAFCRNGSDSWVLFNVNNDEHGWIDAVYIDGSFFVVSMTGAIAVCDVESHGVLIIEPENSIDFSGKFCYLMFSGEDMLMVTRHWTWEFEAHEFELDPDLRTVGFAIYKINVDLVRWDKIQTLGENSLFLGMNYSHSFSAADFVGCRPNSIYFTDDIRGGKHDIGIYSLSDQSFQPLPSYPQKPYYLLGFPIWVTPNPL